MKIRKFYKKDAKECYKLISNVLKNEEKKRSLQKRVKEILLKQANPEGLIKKSNSRDYFICEKNGRIIGMGGLKKNEVIRMYTSPSFQKKGIGTKILKRIEKQARKNKIKKLFLYTHPEALQFYLKNKFMVIKKFKDRKLNVIYMEKTLK